MVKLVKERPLHRKHSSQGNCSSSRARDVGHVSDADQTIPTSSSNLSSNTPINIPPIPPLGGVGDIGIFNREKIKKNEDEKILLNNTEWSVLELVVELNKQSPTTRKRLLDELALGLKQNTTASSSRDVEMWLKSVAAELTVVLSSYQYTGNMKAQNVVGWSYVEEFMHSSGLSRCTVVQRAGVYKLLAGLLVKHARGIAEHVGQPLSLKFTMSCSNAVPGLFDAAYPGYLQAGMAAAVVAAMRT